MTKLLDSKNYKVVGTRPVRHDGADKVTGRAIYGADIKLPGLLFGAVLRSPYAHAKLLKVDASKALLLDGVFAVVTSKDLPKAESKTVDFGEGAINYKWASNNILAPIGGKVLYKGHAVAAVSAKDRATAEMACRLIDVEYEPLTSSTNVSDSLKKGAPIILEDLVGEHLGKEVKNTNLAKHSRYEIGDITPHLKKADYNVHGKYEMQMVHQGYIEPHTATAVWDESDSIKVFTSTQGGFPARSQTAGILKIKESKVTVTPLEIGGGFGGKITVYLEPIAALLSKKSNNLPVKITMRRNEVFEATGPAPGGEVEVWIGANMDGKIVYAKAVIKYEAGAYPGSAVGGGAICIFSPYDIPNILIDTYDVLVNKPKSAAYRAPGSPQAAFAMESAVDDLCKKANWDPLEFRVKNASKEGTRRADGAKFPVIGNLEVLEKVAQSKHWNADLGTPKPNCLRGRGVASGYWMNVGLRSSVTMSLDNDGTITLIEGSTDIGGTRTSLAMQAAEILGIPVEDVKPLVVDTNSVGYNNVTGGSRVTYATGYAVCKAAFEIVEKLKKRASIVFQVKPSEVEFSDGKFYAPDKSSKTFKEVCLSLDTTGAPISVSTGVNMRSAGGSFGTHIVDVEVDTETGKTDVIRYTVVQDVGRAIHPAYVEGQMQGGAVQGIGWALSEEYFMTKEGEMANPTFLDYRMPTSYDVPKIETIIVEKPNPEHPFGVRGVGEVPICPPIGAIANAIYSATGVRLYSTPMKPSKLLKELLKN